MIDLSRTDHRLDIHMDISIAIFKVYMYHRYVAQVMRQPCLTYFFGRILDRNSIIGICHVVQFHNSVVHSEQNHLQIIPQLIHMFIVIFYL